MTSDQRALRTAAADTRVRRAFEEADPPSYGVSLVAVGGYGRGELAPGSDLDLVLLHADDLAPTPGGGPTSQHADGPLLPSLAEGIWMPLWDGPHRLDHAVRSETGMREAAAADLRVALGALDLRHVAGDPGLTLRVRTRLLADWRRAARRRLPELAALMARRHATAGELAHVAVPDLKESEGGLRDAGIVKALVATWLVDAPQADLEPARRLLLDVRDEVHALSGRSSDRLTPELWADLAVALRVKDAEAAQRLVRETARRVSHLSRLTWRRVDALLARPTRGRRPELHALGGGVAISRGEVVLERGAAPGRDPGLLLRAAASAAERDLVLAPATAARLAREAAPLPAVWPAGVRTAWIRLLAAGPGLRDVWATLEETGALNRLFPEWELLRSLPHAAAVHRFTVDRHVLETCVEAASLLSRVSRPDLLVVAALLHDMGKGSRDEAEPGGHSASGARLARDLATRFGFPADDVEVIETLVRWHLLLAETATSRDPHDPRTVAHLVERVPDRQTLALLLALTEADARATSVKAWSSWRAGLIRDLAARADRALLHRRTPEPDQEYAAVTVPQTVKTDPGRVEVEVVRQPDGALVRVFARDRVGLLADVAAVLTHLRIPIRGARAWPQGAVGVSEWHTSEDAPAAAVLRERIQAEVEGRTRAGAPAPAGGGAAAFVLVDPDASTTATVLEVRTADRPGLVHRVCAALAGVGVAVRSAHVDIFGPQAVDVFYVQEPGAGPLDAARAEEASAVVRAALEGSAPARDPSGVE